MSGGEKLLDRMRSNPRDWRIDDIIAVCRAFDVDCTAPTAGSHYKVKHASMPEILTVPARRPIKPVYVRELVRFIDRAREVMR